MPPWSRSIRQNFALNTHITMRCPFTDFRTYKLRYFNCIVSIFLPITCHEGIDEQYAYNSTLSLTSVLDWDGWLTPRPGRFTHGIHCTGGWVGPRVGLDGREKSRRQPISGFYPRTCESLHHLCYLGSQYPWPSLKPHWGSTGKAPLILTLGTARRWVVNFTLRPFYPEKEVRYPLNRRLDGPRAAGAERFGVEKNLLLLQGFEICSVQLVA
jgi:hypothetical protein